METVKTQSLVIGGGPGGYVAAIRLAQLGKQVTLVEAENVGGVCLNVGCIPSKALISAANEVHGLQHAQEMGITVEGLKVDFSKMQTWKGSVVKKLTGGVAQLLKGNKVKVISGRARFRTAKEIQVSGQDGEMLVLAESTIIATGSRPIEIPGFKFDGKRILSSTEALALPEIPKKMIVIGGGYIGLELGTAYAKLGSDVTVVEALDQILAGFDADIARTLSRRLTKVGVKTILGAKAKGWTEANNQAVLTIEHNGQEQKLEADVILVTVGRRPNAEDLGLSDIGVTVDAKGFIPVNDRQETNVKGIYAIGDVAGQPMLAHKASREGEVAAEVIAGHPTVFDVQTIPAVVFTDPEIAVAGMSEKEAAEKGFTPITGKFSFAANGRALTHGDADGFVKVVADKDSKILLGVQVVGPNASDLISEACLAIEMGAVLDDVALTIHPHPTLPEALMEAMKAATGEAIHALNK